MKIITLSISLLLTVNVISQTTFNSQPSASIGKDASLGYHDNFSTSSSNYGTDLYLKAFCMPGASGGDNTNRGVLEFDLSSIPQNATILSATIELYGAGYVNSLLPGHFGSNTLKVSKITGAWNENTITWDSPVSISNTDMFTVPPSVNSSQDYSLDVTNWVVNNFASQNQTIGVHLQLNTENSSNSAAVVFNSSDHPDSLKRPKIIVEYQLDQNQVLCFSNEGSTDNDASLGYHDNYSTASTNYGTDQYLKAFCIDGAMGGENKNRGLLYFDLSTIPSNSTVISATLSLKATGYINSLLPGHFGQNSTSLSRVLSPWNINSVTWNTQPSITASEQVILSNSTSFDQDYSINVLPIVDDMISSPSTNFGFLMQLQNESLQSQAALVFHSSNATDPSLRPELCVAYKLDNLSITNYFDGVYNLQLYPNPTNGELTVKMLNENVNIDSYSVLDLNGKTVIASTKLNENISSFIVNIENVDSGTYFIYLQLENGEILKKKICKN